MLKLLLSHIAPFIILTFYGGVKCIHGHDPTLDIIGGDTTDISQHPYQVSIWADEEFRGSGALIREDWVVTTASTVFGYDQNALKVRAYSSHAEDGGIVFSIDKIFTHPFFRVNNMTNDVALLKLAKVIKTAIRHTVPISSHALPVNATGILSGFGSTSNSTKMSNQLQQVSSRVIDTQACQLEYGDDFFIDESQFCVQAENVFGPCWGDTGDLLVSEGVLFGLLSWNRGCYDVIESSVFTDLSRTKYWINRIIWRHSRPRRLKPAAVASKLFEIV